MCYFPTAGLFWGYEALDKIREVLNVDFSDILTSIPKIDNTPSIIKETSDDTYDEIRITLKNYMRENMLTPKAISKKSGLSINTVYSFLNGNSISNLSVKKLVGIGDNFVNEINHLTNANICVYPEIKTYCNKCGKQGKVCWGSRRYFNHNNEWETYCAFGFEQEIDNDGNPFVTKECPHPLKGKDFTSAMKKFGFIEKDDVIHNYSGGNENEG